MTTLGLSVRISIRAAVFSAALNVLLQLKENHRSLRGRFPTEGVYTLCCSLLRELPYIALLKGILNYFSMLEADACVTTPATSDRSTSLSPTRDYAHLLHEIMPLGAGLLPHLLMLSYCEAL